MKQTEIQSVSPASHAEACVRVAGRFSQRWLRHYASSKLRWDPIFATVAELLRETSEPLLDLGCGVGLLPFYLRERGFAAPITGLEIDSRKVSHARRALTPEDVGLTFAEEDVSRDLPDFLGNVALLDVLHYLAPADQTSLLVKLSRLVAPGGILFIRDCPRETSLRFWMTHAAEFFAQTISWNLGVPLNFPTRDSIDATFDAAEFTSEERPMYQGGPFNNRLFIFRRR